MGRKGNQSQWESQRSSKKEERQIRANHKKERQKKRYRNTATEDQEFREQLATVGLRWKEIKGDGNCLFRTFADQLHGDESRHTEVRQKCMDLMEADRDHYQWFVEEEEYEDDFDRYLCDLRGDGAWGGNLEIQCVAMAFKINVVIHVHASPRWEVANFGAEARTVQLSYHEGNHYNSVRGTNQSKPFLNHCILRLLIPGQASLRQTMGCLHR